MRKREHFGSRFAVIMAMAGSAVGLGNIWRFPYVMGQYGGAAFILIYVAASILLALPIFYAESIIGRRARTDTFGAMKKLAPGTAWRWAGLLTILSPLLILCYYSVVGGWSVEYLFKSLSFSFTEVPAEEVPHFFKRFISSPWQPIFVHTAFMALVAGIVLGGVKDGIEKFSFHFEGDLDRSGRSVLAIRPLMWKDGWPVAGKPFENGEYSIVSERRGYSLELAVNNVPMNTGARGVSRNADGPVVALEDQKLSDVIGTWPEGNINLRIGPELFRPHQAWVITEVPEAGGYIGGAYCKITLAGTDRTLTATADREITTVPGFTGAPEQLWRIDQLTDGTYRIMPKLVPGTDQELVLISVADSTPSLGVFDPDSDNSKWNLNKH